MAAGAAMATNEELIERLQVAGEGTPEAAAIMGELWGQNIRLVRLTVHRLTGLNVGEQGFEDMEQQAYFSFRAAAYAYDPAEGLAFSTVFSKRIKWELCRYYERGGFTIRIPAYMKQRFRDCAKKKRELERETGRAVTYEEALNAMGLHPAAVAGTLAALRRQETASLEAEAYGSEDGDSVSLLDKLADGADMETDVIERVWQRELHAALMSALQDVPEGARGIISRHYFGGMSIGHMAQEYGITRQAVYDREQKAFRSIRAGRYGAELAEFMPSMSKKERADRLIREDRAAVARLQLSDTEKELLAL